ncbi:GRIP1-associated protein 1, partial [Geodia barretti]
MNLKCNSLIQEKEGVVRERDELNSLAEELGRELHQSKAQVGELRTETEYLNTQLEEARLSQEQLADQVAKASEDRQTLEKKLESAEKLAEKRKTLVDEMSIRGQETAEEQKKKMEVVQEKLRKEVESLERLLDEERSEVRRLSTANDEIPELQKRLRSLEEEKESHTTTVTNLEATIKEQRESRETELQRLTEEHETDKESLSSLLSEVRREVEEERVRARELEMAAQDKEEMVRIVEKKSNALLKDLKRQLVHMQKREEKRQEQLPELTTGGEGYGAGHEQSADNVSKHSRESSLSSIRGHLPAEGSISSPSSSYGPAGGSSSFPLNVGGVSEEMRDLLARVTELQREKWVLEERVNHLETTGSALADDVVNKSEIIKSYYMHNKADHTPPRRTGREELLRPLIFL